MRPGTILFAHAACTGLASQMLKSGKVKMLKWCTTTHPYLPGYNNHLHDLLNYFSHHNRMYYFINTIVFTTAIIAKDK